LVEYARESFLSGRADTNLAAVDLVVIGAVAGFVAELEHPGSISSAA
jgi:curli biogenesis system outer membrane secretion channel CsgG